MSWLISQYRLVSPLCVSSSTSFGKRRESSREICRVLDVHLEILLLECASRDALIRKLQRDPARRPSRGGSARHGPSDDQVSAPIEMV
ncbi:hypothetical protein BHE74_00051767 [Ensete ventricosum]|nr:hypothetical protein BHE74_00051767 [Ensete ventricosum]